MLLSRKQIIVSKVSPVSGRGRICRGLANGVLPRVLPWALLLALLFLAGCGEVYYYWQAGVGQLEIIRKRRPLEEVLKDEKVPAVVKRKLALIQAAQEFGVQKLALPEDGQYRYYADLERPAVSWLVVAAPEFSLQEHQFCYFIVGCLGYRGYFDREDAEELSLEMSEEGLDVLVRPVHAYSTLGWFDDPVLNTFLYDSETSLVGTIFHEMSHRRYFLSGETAFNESFAQFVEEIGLRRFLLSAEGKSALPALEVSLERWKGIQRERKLYRDLVLKTRGRLEALYANGLPEADKRVEKARLLEKMRGDYQKNRNSFKILNYDGWFKQPLNNAHLAGFSQYASYVGAFQALFRQHGGDFDRFYQAVEELGALPRKERETRLTQLENAFVATTTPANNP